MSSRYNTLCLPSIKLPLADPRSPLGAFGAPGLLGTPRAPQGSKEPLGYPGGPGSSEKLLWAPRGS